MTSKPKEIFFFCVTFRHARPVCRGISSTLNCHVTLSRTPKLFIYCGVQLNLNLLPEIQCYRLSSDALSAANGELGDSRSPTHSVHRILRRKCPIPISTLHLHSKYEISDPLTVRSDTITKYALSVVRVRGVPVASDRSRQRSYAH